MPEVYFEDLNEIRLQQDSLIYFVLQISTRDATSIKNFTKTEHKNVKLTLVETYSVKFTDIC